MGVLKALGSEQACLTKPWWLVSKTGEAVCEPAACQKLIFSFLWGRSGGSMTVCEVLIRRRGGVWEGGGRGGLWLRYGRLL